MVRYVPCLAQYSVNILNFRILKKELKRQTVITLCEMAESCRYVVLPYFHFPDLYSIIRQMLMADDHYYFYQDLMLRLIGRLGYIGQEEFMGLQVLNARNGQMEDNFRAVFGNTFFIQQYDRFKDGKDSLSQRRLAIEGAFYNEDKVLHSSIEIHNYVEYIITTLVSNLSLAVPETTLLPILQTICNLIPAIRDEDDCRLLHSHLFPRLLDIEQKYSGQVL